MGARGLVGVRCVLWGVIGIAKNSATGPRRTRPDANASLAWDRCANNVGYVVETTDGKKRHPDARALKRSFRCWCIRRCQQIGAGSNHGGGNPEHRRGAANVRGFGAGSADQGCVDADWFIGFCVGGVFTVCTPVLANGKAYHGLCIYA